MALSSFLGLASAALIVILLGIYKPYLSNENANAASTESILVQLKRAASPPTFERDTLVLYILRPEDAEALESLQYFLEHAINLDRGRGKYVILVPKQQSEDLALPELPSPQATYLIHDSDCSFWGLYGYALRHTAGVPDGMQSTELLAALPYSHFFLTGSMVRGPFIPPLLKAHIPWWEPFLERLGRPVQATSDNDKQRSVHMVGPVVTCEPGFQVFEDAEIDPAIADMTNASEYEEVDEQGSASGVNAERKGGLGEEKQDDMHSSSKAGLRSSEGSTDGSRIKGDRSQEEGKTHELRSKNVDGEPDAPVTRSNSGRELLLHRANKDSKDLSKVVLQAKVGRELLAASLQSKEETGGVIQSSAGSGSGSAGSLSSRPLAVGDGLSSARSGSAAGSAAGSGQQGSAQGSAASSQTMGSSSSSGSGAGGGQLDDQEQEGVLLAEEDGSGGEGVQDEPPFVAPLALAVDREGLQALIDAELLAATNTACTAHASAHTALRSASHAILEAGHGLACLLTRYQQALPDAEVAAADTAASDSTAGKEAGRNAESAEEADRKVLDWSDKRLWGCNGGTSPFVPFGNDGLSVNPFEVVFVPWESRELRGKHAHPRWHADGQSTLLTAKRYTHWALAQSAGPRNRSANALANYYVHHQPQLRTPKVLEAIAHGQACFDVAYYLARNPDLAPLGSDKSLWRHYVYYGQFEPRMFRFTCPLDYTRFVAPVPSV